MRRTMLLVAGAAVLVAVIAGAVSSVLAGGPSGAETVTSASSVTLPAGARQTRWVIHDLGTLGELGNSASAINARGQIVGRADTKVKDADGFAIYHAFLWEKGKRCVTSAPSAGRIARRLRSTGAARLSGRGTRRRSPSTPPIPRVGPFTSTTPSSGRSAAADRPTARPVDAAARHLPLVFCPECWQRQFGSSG